MTAQTAVRMWSRHDASIQSDGGKKYTTTIRETYQVVCDAGDGVGVILGAPGLPYLDDIYPGTAQIRVKSKSPSQVSPIFWLVEVVYEGPFGPQGSSDSPLNQRPIVRWGKIESDEPIDEDLAGKAITTVNGEPISGVTKKISDLTLTVTRNYAKIDLAATYEYLHSVNSDTFVGFQPGVCRLVEFSAEEKIVAAVGGYYEVTAGFHFRWPYRTTPLKAWYARVLHQGFKVKKSLVGPPAPGQSTSSIANAVDDKGQELTRPVMLKTDGTEEKNPQMANWLEFQIYKPMPYNALGLF
jgi:hypothetical protein